MGFYDRLIGHLRSLEPSRRELLVANLHRAIAQTGISDTPSDELRMEALARRGFYLALKIGSELKSEKPDDPKSGVPRLCWKELAKELKDFREQLALGTAIAEPEAKDVDHFCTMKVRRRPSQKKGTYVLWALYLLWLEDVQGEYKNEFYRGLVPADATLAQSIWLFLSRRMNNEAEAAKDPLPFDDVKRPRDQYALRSVAQPFILNDHHVDRLKPIFRRCQSPVDGNLHLAIYRVRQSKANQLMKSFLAWIPREGSDGEFSSLHIYKAPAQEGGTVRATPGRVIPLDAGVYVLGGQRSEPMRQHRSGTNRPPPEPFRALEVLFFPWNSLESNHLFRGLMLSVNDKGVPLIGYTCARPTLVSRHEDAGLGEVSVGGLGLALEGERLAELELTKNMADPEAAAESVNEIYAEYGTVEQLAERVVDGCNNRPQRWSAPADFFAGGKPLTLNTIDAMLERALDGISHIGDPDRSFKLMSDLLFSPLSRR